MVGVWAPAFSTPQQRDPQEHGEIQDPAEFRSSVSTRSLPRTHHGYHAAPARLSSAAAACTSDQRSANRSGQRTPPGSRLPTTRVPTT